MATVTIYNQDNKQVGERELAEAVFNTEVKEYLLHDMVRYQLAARRQGTAATKNRSAVAGGGKKPYRQKGTGNARQGTTRAPHFVGGGAAFGPSPRSYDFKLNRKVKKAALCSALSARYQAEKLVVVDKLSMDKISTKSFAELVSRFKLDGVLFIIDQANSMVELSARNLHNVKILRADGANVYDILKYPHLVLTDAAVTEIEGALEK
ncbi:LSU ribosomal protein L4P [Desulfuromusa kysingii]|uniref:Large ribosomal subunit protein uL4 n=1 Tax=Desulfuromusa kysingii TaxID=37625 RepID=A0A1H3WDL1_9BACT|nr:50S ribosomal protein L4 [Desulfuromusa kysingii]SDZ84328.1 LSU ribosomal protein L4P [Desulfuromusa kysingii]